MEFFQRKDHDSYVKLILIDDKEGRKNEILKTTTLLKSANIYEHTWLRPIEKAKNVSQYMSKDKFVYISHPQTVIGFIRQMILV